jgi:hypothetical protein
MDGVLVDFVKGAKDFYNLDIEVKEWNFIKHLPMTTDEFWQPLGREFWANLEWMPDGREILDLVEYYFAPVDICLLSTPSFEPGCLAGKVDWINRHMPTYKHRYLLGPAKNFCANKDSILIDDHEANIQEFIQVSGYGLLCPRPWNQFKSSENTINVLTNHLERVIRYGKD